MDLKFIVETSTEKMTCSTIEQAINCYNLLPSDDGYIKGLEHWNINKCISAYEDTKPIHLSPILVCKEGQPVLFDNANHQNEFGFFGDFQFSVDTISTLLKAFNIQQEINPAGMVDFQNRYYILKSFYSTSSYNELLEKGIIANYKDYSVSHSDRCIESASPFSIECSGEHQIKCGDVIVMQDRQNCRAFFREKDKYRPIPGFFYNKNSPNVLRSPVGNIVSDFPFLQENPMPQSKINTVASMYGIFNAIVYLENKKYNSLALVNYLADKQFKTIGMRFEMGTTPNEFFVDLIKNTPVFPKEALAYYFLLHSYFNEIEDIYHSNFMKVRAMNPLTKEQILPFHIDTLEYVEQARNELENKPLGGPYQLPTLPSIKEYYFGLQYIYHQNITTEKIDYSNKDELSCDTYLYSVDKRLKELLEVNRVLYKDKSHINKPDHKKNFHIVR